MGAMGIDEHGLLEAWRGGDRDAGDVLLRRHFDSVCRFFRNRLGDDVDDLVQRTFLDCVESKTKIRDHSSVRAYVLAIARNRFYDHLRSGRRAPNVAPLSEMSLRDLGTSPSLRVARSQDERVVLEALQTVGSDHQITLELTYWEQLSGREVADVLGVPHNTIRSRLSRARAALGKALEDTDGAGALERLLGVPEPESAAADEA